jgi:hypothetical protein
MAVISDLAPKGRNRTAQSVLRIAIEDNGDGIHGDNVDLVDAGFCGAGVRYSLVAAARLWRAMLRDRE